MARETLDDRAASQASGARGGGGAGSDRGEGREHTHAECVGPVSIERLRKDDGRALVLYSRSGDRKS